MSILFCRINVSTIGPTQLMSPNSMAILWLILSLSPIWTNLTSISSKFLRYGYMRSVLVGNQLFLLLKLCFTSWIFSPFRIQSFLCSRRIVLSLMSNSKICHLYGEAKIWTFAWRLWPWTLSREWTLSCNYFDIDLGYWVFVPKSHHFIALYYWQELLRTYHSHNLPRKLHTHCFNELMLSLNGFMLQGDYTRTIKHFHFLEWPDFSASVDSTVVIDFIQTVRTHITPEVKGPILIHCR